MSCLVAWDFQSSDPLPSCSLGLKRHALMHITSRLLHSLEDILLETVLFIILLSCLRSDIVILDTLIVFNLLTYLFPHYKGSEIHIKWNFSGAREQYWPDVLPDATSYSHG